VLGFEANASYHIKIIFYTISPRSKIASANYAISSTLKRESLLVSKVNFSTTGDF
jgi:hypothetical protein